MKRYYLRKIGLILILPFIQATGQTYVGDYTGHTVAGKAISVHAGASSARFIFYQADILRVDFLPAPGTVLDSSFVVTQDTTEMVSLFITETDSTLEIASPSINVRCSKYPLRVSYYDATGRLLLAEPVSGGLATDQSARVANFSLSPSEHFYGTGERGIGLDLRGLAFDSYNTQVYGYGSALSTMNINIPFLASTNGYALYFENTYKGRFNLGSIDPSTFSYRTLGGELSYYFIAASTTKDQLERYTWLTGRQPLPPRWAFGFLQSKFGYQTETAARSMVQTMRQKQIPCDAIILDLYWFDRMGDISWNLATFPTPFQMMTDFLTQGIKTVVITEPYVIINSSNFGEASFNRYLGTDASGQTYLLDNWWSCNCDAGLLDMTKPAARDWWWNKHPPFFGSQLAGIWTDLGEPERHPDDMMHHLGSTMKTHNIYNLVWAKTIFEGFNQFRSNQRLVNLTRSGYAGIQRYGVVPWSGDVAKNFSGLSVQLPMLLNMGMSGLGYHNSDIGGFCCGFTTPELYVRWMQYGTFCPITRAHGAGPAVGGQDTEPWAFGATAEDISRHYIQLRYQLLPYIYTFARENYETGTPLARPLFFDYPTDNTLYNHSSSYLWGDAILVSPVVQAGQTTKDVYLPQGRWVYYWDDQVYNGGQSINVATPLEIMPIFVKSGSIIPRQPIMNYTNERPLDTLMLSVYPSSIEDATFTLYEDDGQTLDYQSASFALTEFTQSLVVTSSLTSMNIEIGAAQGTYTGKPQQRVYLTDVHGISASPTAVRKNGVLLPERFSYAELRAGGDGFFYDSASDILYIHTPTNADSSYQLLAENIVLSTLDDHKHIPAEFRLEQNYPNPFNPTTVIRYSIPGRTRVALRVYDILGQLVATLVDEVKEAGTYELSVDVTSIGAQSSGDYFYRLTTEQGSLTKKMIVTK
jgi:alpha-glucosidase (family GH31 glycosyl hydrolase)